MAVAFKHVFAQGPSLRALGGVALSALSQQLASSGIGASFGVPRLTAGDGAGATIVTPGAWISAEIPPRPASLVDAFVRHVGGDPSAYRGILPPSLFPQWAFPLAARTLEGIPYPLVRVVNAGCLIDVRAPLPAGEPLVVRARLAKIEDDGRRALITQEIVTGTRSVEEALLCEMRAIVPSRTKVKGERVDGKRTSEREKTRPSVPTDAREIGFQRIGDRAGLDFAKLTGDFNPIHWVGPWARVSGFKSCILHGFSTLARAVESMNRALFAGDVSRLARIDVRFTRPLVLPARVGVYVRGDRVWVGDAPGGGAYLEGRFATESSSSRASKSGA